MSREITVRKYLSFMRAINNMDAFHSTITTGKFKVSSILIPLMIKRGWLKKIKAYTFKWIGSSPTEGMAKDIAQDCNNYHKEKMIRRAEKLEKVQPIAHAEASIHTNFSDDVAGEAALLAELAVKLGKKDILGFIRQGQKSF